MKRKSVIFLWAGWLVLSLVTSAVAVEPSMSEYTSYPIFMAQSTKPNILIMLDNSGSMNFNAYGTYPGDGGLVGDTPYGGEPYCGTIEVRLGSEQDDTEQRTNDNATYYDDATLHLGRASSTQPIIAGLRFQDVQVPQGTTIVRAYLEFKASANSSGSTPPSLQIFGEASDNAAAYTGKMSSYVYNEVSSRPSTAASVTWNSASAPALSSWTQNNIYRTPDISAIVQQIVQRTGWQNGNAMAFKIQYATSSSYSRAAYSRYPTTNATYAPLLHIEIQNDVTQCKSYYGYFNSQWFYKIQSSAFNMQYRKVAYGDATCPGSWHVTTTAGVSQCLSDATIASEQLWDGNWMNWATMRRIDVARKVLMGGKATSRVGGGNTTLIGETPNQPTRTFVKRFDSTAGQGVAVTPYDGNYYYGLSGGYIYVDTDSNPFSGYVARYKLDVKKDVTFEPDDFLDGNIAGVLQKIGDRAYWGNEFFYYGSGNNQEGGFISNRIGMNMTPIITNLENTGADTWTPLAEAFYVATEYFKQEDPNSFNGINNNLGYSNSCNSPFNNTNDPYYKGSEFVPCTKSFVILITDGASTEDRNVPESLKDYDSDHQDPGIYESNGSDYLDDVALYAHTTDLRTVLDGKQNLALYTIYAFGDDAGAKQLLKDAARNGGFVDKNSNNAPDGTYTDPAAARLEWDANSDGNPDTYFEAKDGEELENQLMGAITDILKKAASGTAVSVLATSSQGEGNLVQAYFQPLATSGTQEVKWVGYLQSLWVDDRGFLREDTNANLTLDTDSDNVITYFVDDNGNTRVKRFSVNATNPYPDFSTDPYSVAALDEIVPIWEAGKVLAQTLPNERNVFTSLPGGSGTYFGGDKFDVDNPSIKPYLGVADNTAWSYLGATQGQRVDNLIQWTRGADTGFSGVTNMRSRMLDDNIWKLGDIVNSTPATISRPLENYGLIYSDESYQGFLHAYKNRETVVYVGANDGMMHAFSSWTYNESARRFEKPALAEAAEAIGTELWAYCPRALLPHLKWLPSKDYTHVYYVDLQPKITDAKIFTPDAVHVNGWGTVLIGGLNMGGKAISVTDDFNGDGPPFETRSLTPSYFAIDVTDPRAPKLLWEKSYTDLGMSMSFPAVVKVADKWYLVFGSGPETYDGTSSTKGHVYVVDLATGQPYSSTSTDWLFETSENKAFMNGAVSLDQTLNYNVDAVYVGESYESGTNWMGAIYKIAVPWRCTASAAECANISYGDLENGAYDTSPLNWKFSRLFGAVPGPVTSPAALSVDSLGNAWVYFGTGRYFSETDKTSTASQYLFGIKDPFFNENYDGSDYHKYLATPRELSSSDLLTADSYTIDGESVFTGATRWGSWKDFLSLARSKDGWQRTLPSAGERMLSKPAVLGGLVLYSTYLPTSGACSFGGSSALYYPYYETGTAHPLTRTVSVPLGMGKPSKIGIQVLPKKGKVPPSGGGDGDDQPADATGFVQLSTGEIMELGLETVLDIRSGLTSWREKRKD